MKVYKIMNVETGLFSKGGGYPSWSKHGKIWVSIGAIKLHLNYVRAYSSILKKMRIIEYELKEVRAVPIEELKPKWVIEDIIEA